LHGLPFLAYRRNQEAIRNEEIKTTANVYSIVKITQFSGSNDSCGLSSRSLRQKGWQMQTCTPIELKKRDITARSLSRCQLALGVLGIG
jgi:hypothetical protein